MLFFAWSIWKVQFKQYVHKHLVMAFHTFHRLKIKLVLIMMSTFCTCHNYTKYCRGPPLG